MMAKFLLCPSLETICVGPHTAILDTPIAIKVPTRNSWVYHSQVKFSRLKEKQGGRIDEWSCKIIRKS